LFVAVAGVVGVVVVVGIGGGRQREAKEGEKG
jgi:hypothetical protein